jgi:SAM-dependent methyltransferase
MRRHFEIESQLAEKLRAASRAERKTLYSSVYDELFTRVPNHPQVVKKTQGRTARQQSILRSLLALTRRMTHKDTVFLEIGAGDCRLSLSLAPHVKKVYAIDVSEQITKSEIQPDNFTLILSDGCSIPVPAGEVNVAFSNQLMEHLHPDDALEQLKNIHNALKDGGMYVCITPSCLSGPHDISRYFSDEPRGFHLKEYSSTELVDEFRKAGFARCDVFFWSRGIFFLLPASSVVWLEKLLFGLPQSWRQRLAGTYPLNRVLGNFIGYK